MARRQSSLLSPEAADAEVHRLYRIARHRSGQTQQVAQSIDPHTVKREQVVAQVAAAGKERRKAFGTR